MLCLGSSYLTSRLLGRRAGSGEDLFDSPAGAVDGGPSEVGTARSGLEEPGSLPLRGGSLLRVFLLTRFPSASLACSLPLTPPPFFFTFF